MSIYCYIYCVTHTGLKNFAIIHNKTMKRTSFIAAFVANAANAILTKPGITPDIVFKAANDYADEAERRGYVEPDSNQYSKTSEYESKLEEAISAIREELAGGKSSARKHLQQALVRKLGITKSFAEESVDYAYTTGVIVKSDPSLHYSPVILSEQ